MLTLSVVEHGKRGLFGVSAIHGMSYAQDLEIRKLVEASDTISKALEIAKDKMDAPKIAALTVAVDEISAKITAAENAISCDMRYGTVGMTQTPQGQTADICYGGLGIAKIADGHTADICSGAITVSKRSHGNTVVNINNCH